MGATHKDYTDRSNINTLGWNSNTKKHGGEKRQVRCLLLNLGYPDDLHKMQHIIRLFSKTIGNQTLSCKIICTQYWNEFKQYLNQK